MAIARAYPKAVVDGIDLDEASIAAAQENLAGSGLEDRVTFHHRDAADAGLQGQYDFVYMHESLHDMSYPVDVLRACRGLLGEGGTLVVGDERVADSFPALGDDIERLYYGFSILHCLPVGMVGEGAAGTGTVMRADTVRSTRRRRDSPASRCCRSRTTSTASTGSRRNVPPKIVVVGTTCSGKTTVARRLAEQHGVPHVELDALHWGPNWSEPERRGVPCARRERALGAGWVADGSYHGKLGDLVLEQADLVVWLDPPLPTILGRVWARTLRRIRTREELWGGNRETWRGAFLSRDSLFSGREDAPAPRRRYEQRLARFDVVRLRSRATSRRGSPNA